MIQNYITMSREHYFSLSFLNKLQVSLIKAHVAYSSIYKWMSYWLINKGFSVRNCMYLYSKTSLKSKPGKLSINRTDILNLCQFETLLSLNPCLLWTMFDLNVSLYYNSLIISLGWQLCAIFQITIISLCSVFSQLPPFVCSVTVICL